MKRILAITMTLAMLVAGCGGAKKSDTPASGGSSTGTVKLKIATVTPLSGGQSSLGSAISNGAKLAVMDRKAELDAAGLSVEVSPQDDQADPNTAPTIAQRLVADKDVVGVVGTLNSGVAKSLAPGLKDAHVVMVSPANTGVALTESGWTNYTRIVARDDKQGPAAAQATKDTLKAKTVYVLHDKTEYGQGLATEYVKEAKKIGLTVANGDGEGINPKDTDFGPVVTKINAAKPDAVFYGGIYDTASLIFKQAVEAGYKGLFIGADGLDDPTIVKNSGEAANKVYYTSVADNVFGTANGKSFVERYKKAFNGSEPPTYAVYGYDCANLIMDALIKYAKDNKGKTPTREEVEKLVKATKGFKGMAGEVTFDAKGDNPSAHVFLYQVQNKTYPGVSLGGIGK